MSWPIMFIHNMMGDFFSLMRQIESECNDFDWTGGSGLSQDIYNEGPSYSGGTYRLGDGGNTSHRDTGMTARDLRARAARSRMTAEETEIQQLCGCGHESKFLPKPSMGETEKDSESENNDMDTS